MKKMSNYLMLAISIVLLSVLSLPMSADLSDKRISVTCPYVSQGQLVDGGTITGANVFTDASELHNYIYFVESTAGSTAFISLPDLNMCVEGTEVIFIVGSNPDYTHFSIQSNGFFLLGNGQVSPVLLVSSNEFRVLRLVAASFGGVTSWTVVN